MDISQFTKANLKFSLHGLYVMWLPVSADQTEHIFFCGVIQSAVQGSVSEVVYYAIVTFTMTERISSSNVSFF